MNTDRHGWLLAGLVASAGIAFGFALHFRSNERALQDQLLLARAQTESQLVAEPAPAPEPPAATTNNTVDETKELRGRIRELEASLKAKDDVIFALRQANTNQAPAPDAFWRRRQDWLDNLKTTDPTQYEAVVKQRAEARQRVLDAYATKASHFLNADTSQMSDDEQQQYTVMLQLLNQAWSLADQLKADLPPDQRRELAGQLRDDVRQLTPLLDQERNREFYQLGLSLGYTDTNATVFAGYLSNVVESTSTRALFPGPRSGGPPSNAAPASASSAGMPQGTSARTR